VWVVQSCGRVGFPTESPLKVHAFGQMGRQDFKGYDAVGVGVEGPPHLTHPATAQQLNQAVATEGRPVRSVLPCHDQNASDPPQPAQSIRQAACAGGARQGR